MRDGVVEGGDGSEGAGPSPGSTPPENAWAVVPGPTALDLMPGWDLASWTVSMVAPGDGANRRKARRRTAEVCARITGRRRDHLHQLTARLVRDNQTIVIEDLTVRTMIENRRLARAISDAAWAELRRMRSTRPPGTAAT
ncbi:hypothetical protein GCM10010358_63370 [Streptomyces minutiscleroticus]|uniref:Probable transposase IS891/IS1136/IS1341 domain-containing protein n=1 Tax=Streptomyces minutiscleroticus TaxID=68238 RepID=A0A918NW71_9ACTN|nr:hypothetical protein GCM10010358_63370 [Streptomyces minutiscleroticus]